MDAPICWRKIIATLQFLDRTLERMDAQQSEKRSMLHKLSVLSVEAT
jgi:hypothetical protein